MTRIICGPNSFLIQRKVNELKEEFLKNNNNLAVELLDGEEVEYASVLSAVESMPFLAEKKLVIVKNFGLNKAAAEQIEELLLKTADTTKLVVVETKIDKRGAYYKFLKKQAGFEELNQPDETDMAGWAVDYSKKRHATISKSDAVYLIDQAGLNQQKLASELDKLIAYDSQVKRENIDQLVELTPSGSIFALVDAVFLGDKKRTLKLYEDQRAMGVEPQNIIGLIVWQLHAVTLMKSAGGRDVNSISGASGVKPFTLQKSKMIADRLKKKQLQKILDNLLDLEIKLKTTSIDPDNALKNFLVASI